MFFKVLFLLACIQLIKEVKSFVRNDVFINDGQCTEISTGAYISAGLTAMFYIMILAICMMPSLLPSILW